MSNQFGDAVDVSCPHCGGAVRCKLCQVADCRQR